MCVKTQMLAKAPKLARRGAMPSNRQAANPKSQPDLHASVKCRVVSDAMQQPGTQVPGAFAAPFAPARNYLLTIGNRICEGYSSE